MAQSEAISGYILPGGLQHVYLRLHLLQEHHTGAMLIIQQGFKFTSAILMAQTINDVQNKPNWIAFKYDKTLLLIYDFLKTHWYGKSLEVSKCPIVNF